MPVFAVQGYLRQCLDSILEQSFTDLEVIAVDDASPDHCPEILDEYATKDPRVRVTHLASNVGLGHARNIGLDAATGEYVWFVDSDDWLSPGALHAVAAQLRRTAPDVMLIDHDRVSWLGRHKPSDGRDLLVARDGCFTLRDEPGLLGLFTVVWNKILRRDFLLRTGIRFDAGWYEDLPFTYPVLVAADRIATLGRVCYHYRTRRQDAITQTLSDRHFEVFDQWDRVFDRLDDLGARAEPFRDKVIERMVWHLLVVQARRDRLPRDTRRAFFHRMSEQVRRYPPSPAAPMPRGDRLRRWLVTTDSYHSYSAVRGVRLAAYNASVHANAVGAWARTRAVSWRRRLRAGLGAAFYHVMRLAPVDRNLAVYAAYWYRGIACNPAAIYTTARQLAPDVRAVWIVARGHRDTMPPGVEHVVSGTPGYYRALARARWLINNVNFPDFVVKRPGTVHLQTHHGTPVKVMGLDQKAFPIGARGMDFAKLMGRCDRWDLSLTSNAHSTESWARAYPCAYETLEYGYPRNDRLAVADRTDVSAARALVDVRDNRTVILYAPTHREYLPGYQPMLDVDAFADALGPDVLVLVRAHYFYRSPGDAPTVSHHGVRDVSNHPCVEDLLLAADVLITDYSSVMFDYAVLDRPIAIFAPDWDAYRRTRGVTFDLLAEPPGVVARTQTDLVDAFRTGAVTGDAAAKTREQFRARFCSLDDGHAAERVVRRLFPIS